MRSSLVLVPLVCILGASLLILPIGDVSADAQHPVPSSDFFSTFPELSVTTSSPAVVFDLSTFPDSVSNVEFLYECLRVSYDNRSLELVDSYAPTWISVSFQYTSILVTVAPGSVCDDTFWIEYRITGGATISMVFPIVVSDSGSSVPEPVGQNTFTLRFDSQGGTIVNSMVVLSSSDSAVFDITGKDPSRSGYSFIGWSSDPDGSSVLTGRTFTVQVLPDEDSGSATLYAVWEESGLRLPTFFDGLGELVTDPVIIGCSLAAFLGSCLFIRWRMSRCRFLCSSRSSA